MTEEVWRPIPGIDHYLASSYGRVMGTYIGRGFATGSRIRKTRIDNQGYEKICYHQNGKAKITGVHTFICAAFNGPKPTPEHTVNHKDGNKLNNRPENLEWATRKEQTNHFYAVLNGIETRPRGYGKQKMAVYTDEEVRKIRVLRNTGLSYRQIKEALGNKSSWVVIQYIIKRKHYAHIT